MSKIRPVVLDTQSLTNKDAELIINNMVNTLYRVDTQGCLIYASPAAEKLTGFSLEELLGKPVTDLYMHPEKREDFLQRLSTSNGMLHNYEVLLKHKDGHGVWVLINVRYVFDQDSNVTGIEGLIRDITAYKETEAKLNHERERALVTLGSITDGVITTDKNGVIEYMNHKAEEMCGNALDKLKGQNIQDYYCPVMQDEQIDFAHPVMECLRTGKVIKISDFRTLQRADGEYCDLLETVSPLYDNKQQLVGAVLVFHDVTEIREMSRRLQHQATHDSHTGLINRAEFEKRLQEAINLAQQDRQQHVLCYLDLDQFKLVNDTCGHIAGDVLLQTLTNNLHSLVREQDTFARLGGDEFGLLIEHCELERGIEIAETIRKAVRQFRFSWEDKVFEIGVSMGLVKIDEESESVTDVLRMADAACFMAKDKGRNRIYTVQKDDAALEKQHQEMHWSYRIRQALEKNEFVLFHQDCKQLSGGHNDPAYTEILIRLEQDGDIIPPMAFIPAAERYNLMNQIDKWVVKAVCNKLKLRPDINSEKHLFAMNLSGTSLSNKKFLNYIIGELEEAQVDPALVCFEVTETAAISNLEHAKRFMQILKGLGCKFALDDFGSGLSSFNYLKYLPVDFLKIDGGIVREIAHDNVSKAMVESINRVGQIMGLKTIAEFVENDNIMNELKYLGVDYGQGYLFSTPKKWE